MKCVPYARLFAMTLFLGLCLPLIAGTYTDEEIASDESVPVQEGIFHPPVRLAADDGVIDSGPSGGHCSPWIVDVDGDGVKDLIVGDFSGCFRFYRNLGTNEKPRYAKAVNLKAGGVDAIVPIY